MFCRYFQTNFEKCHWSLELSPVCQACIENNNKENSENNNKENSENNNKENSENNNKENSENNNKENNKR